MKHLFRYEQNDEEVMSGLTTGKFDMAIKVSVCYTNHTVRM